MNDDKFTDVGWWHSVLSFTREPGAWLLILFAFFVWLWWKYGDRMLESMGRMVNAHIGAREASVDEAKAHARESDARAKATEAENDQLRAAKVTEMQQQIARLEVRLDAAERKSDQFAMNERECLRSLGSMQGELNVLHQLAKDRETLISDKSTALNAALVELRLLREERYGKPPGPT